jgi:hypothetical protein
MANEMKADDARIRVHIERSLCGMAVKLAQVLGEPRWDEIAAEFPADMCDARILEVWEALQDEAAERGWESVWTRIYVAWASDTELWGAEALSPAEALEEARGFGGGQSEN